MVSSGRLVAVFPVDGPDEVAIDPESFDEDLRLELASLE
jgi:hypothetical protein